MRIGGFALAKHRSMRGVGDSVLRGVGATLLLTFRLFLLAAGLIIVALAVTARGLVPDPEVRTHIGEPPSVS